MSDKPASSAKNGSDFMKPFVAGLVLGLLIGGLGGAYLSGLSESSAPRLKPITRSPATAPTGARDARPTDVVPTGAPTGAPTNQALPEPPAKPK